MKLYRMSNGNYYVWDGLQWYVTGKVLSKLLPSAHGSYFTGPFSEGLTLIGNNLKLK